MSVRLRANVPCVFNDTEERENPDLLNPSRRRRIAAGSGNSFVEVNKFIKDFNQAKQLMVGVMSGDMNKMMKQMGINPNNLPKNMPWEEWICPPLKE